MRCRYCKGELIHHYASAYKCTSCGRVFEMFEEESFEDLKNQIERGRGREDERTCNDTDNNNLDFNGNGNTHMVGAFIY